ncbi:hypothetical protein ACA910_002853 [Epithemia clementina (nom. ined.)]
MAVRLATAVRRRRTFSGLPDLNSVACMSLVLNAVFAIALLLLSYGNSVVNLALAKKEVVTWNGGHPSGPQSGTCFCSSYDSYCMCTPSLAIDLVIVSGSNHLWLVRRKDTNQLATMGGFVMIGETVEDAVRRELKEETGIDLGSSSISTTTTKTTTAAAANTRQTRQQPALFGVYSDPRRDNRRHTVSAVYAIHLEGDETPVAADDVKEVKKIPMDDIEKYEYFADHKTILLDYRNYWYSLRRHDDENQEKSSAKIIKNPIGWMMMRHGSSMDFAPDIQRSVCGGSSVGPEMAA